MQTTPTNIYDTPVVLRLPAVRKITGYSTSTIYRLVTEGTFPRQVSLGPKSVGWVEAEVRAWIAARIAERDNTPPSAA